MRSHDGEADEEKLYLQGIDKHITRMGYFQTLLEAQATDQTFYLECTKFWKSGYLAGESAEVVATLTLDALIRYEKDRMGSVEFMAGVAKLWGSADSGDKLVLLSQKVAGDCNWELVIEGDSHFSI